MRAIPYCFFFLIAIKFAGAYETIDNLSVESCNQSTYFDSVGHKCQNCSPFQTASEDRLSCRCNTGYHPEYSEKSRALECVKCDDARQSVYCQTENLTCGVYDIKVLQVVGNDTAAQCLTCPLWLQPDSGRSSCVPCSDMCHCPSEYEDINGTCVRSSDVISDYPALYTINYQGRVYESKYLRDWVIPTASKCKSLGGGKACERLANMCVQSDYNFDSQTACAIHRQLSSSIGLPSLFYDEGSNNNLLNNERINIRKDQRIEFVVKQYGLDGTFQSMKPLLSVFSSMCCTGSWRQVQRNANTRESCSLSSKKFDKEDTQFYELYFVDQSRLINVPLRVLNFVRGGVERNKGDDVSRWQLTKRFFNIDAATGTNQDGNTEFIRYLSSFTIRMSVISDAQPLAIRVPYATITYNLIGSHEREKTPTINFSVENVVNMDEAIRAVQISLSVLSSFASLYVLLRIVVWYRRSDKTTIDLEAIIRLLVYGADILANVIFTVVFFATFYWFITFRQQEEVAISLPDSRDEQFIKDLVISAFTLKAVSVLWMIFEQCSVDVFLIDWENPRPSSKTNVVSVWRTYFVANEWNELQVTRRSSMPLQITFILFTLCVFQLERFGLEVPNSYYKSETMLRYNTVLRLALGSTTYLAFSVVQNLWNSGVVERYVEHKIQRFTDLCALSNISVWLLVQPRYGFYIHGRSPHGFADTDMTTMIQQLQREEENLCAQRGLVQGQDVQTFSMILHRNFIEKWNKVLQTPSTITNQASGNGTTHPFSAMNQFLSSFLDHALRDVDYEVRDRNLVETVLDAELVHFNKQGDRSVLYNDTKNSFDSVLFYGNEAKLVVFDVLLFSLVDMYVHNYVTAGLTTFIIFKVLQFLRYRFGRQNVAKKATIDSRFLF